MTFEEQNSRTHGDQLNHNTRRSSGINIPDIVNSQKASYTSKLDWAGMSGIELPVHIDDPDIGIMTNMGLAEAFVSLDAPDRKGIHMSRLYLSLQKQLKKNHLNLSLLSKILNEFITTHQDISQSAFVSVAYEHMLKRHALVSNNTGWRRYPVKLTGERQGSEETLHITIDITYSSTCPCSAALSRQVMQDRFTEDFQGKSMITKDETLAWLDQNGTIATPHGQRSHASVTIFPKAGSQRSITSYIDLMEEALGTPVQAAVKREDEMEFARRNGSNLMFAEDAARKLKAALESCSDLEHFKIKTVHHESLHPHEAVAYASKQTQ